MHQAIDTMSGHKQHRSFATAMDGGNADNAGAIISLRPVGKKKAAPPKRYRLFQ